MSLHPVEFTDFTTAKLSLPYILSVALVLTSRWTGVTRYDAIMVSRPSSRLAAGDNLLFSIIECPVFVISSIFMEQ